MSNEVDSIKHDADVQRALKQATHEDTTEVRPGAGDKLWLGTHLLLLAGLAAFYYLLGLEWISGGFAKSYIPLLQRLTRGATLIVLVLAAAKVADVYLIARIDSAVARFNLRRIARLVIIALVGFITASTLFVGWYAAIASLGIASIIVGFSLQTTLSSFIGWIYLLVREPYRVGDRIKIGDATGDVIDVSYLDTTLWEFGGPYISGDHPSGRIIKFPNSQILSSAVYNYSWPLFPYIWNEIKFNIAYESDLEFVARTMQETVEEDLGEAMMERVKTFRELLAQTPVDQLDVKERPAVLFRVSENTWLEAIVRYVVIPREAGRVKTRLMKKLLARLNAAPDKVMFPKSNMR
jgi:small-conductance mechanosensitive channel